MMLKTILRGVLGFAFLLVMPLYSAPVGNTAAPRLLEEGFFISRGSWANLRFGYEGDFVYDGRMRQRQEGRGRVDNSRQDTNCGTFTLNFLERLDLYGVFGSSRAKADWRFLTADGMVRRVEMETRYNFLWGMGSRVILYEWGCTDLGIGGRYSSCNYRPAWLTIDGGNVSVSGTHSRFREWQVNFDISYKIDLFTPYIGGKYSNVQMAIGDFSTAISNSGSGEDHFKNRTPVGVYIGCALSTGKNFMLNVEGRFVDEEAITVSGEIKF
jgi:opacity protein-like surface antigen